MFWLSSEYENTQDLIFLFSSFIFYTIFISNVLKLSEKGLLEKIKFRSMTFPDKFIDQDKPDLMYQIAGLDSKAIEEKVYEVLDSKVVVQKKN